MLTTGLWAGCMSDPGDAAREGLFLNGTAAAQSVQGGEEGAATLQLQQAYIQTVNQY